MSEKSQTRRTFRVEIFLVPSTTCDYPAFSTEPGCPKYETALGLDCRQTSKWILEYAAQSRKRDRDHLRVGKAALLASYAPRRRLHPSYPLSKLRRTASESPAHLKCGKIVAR